MASGDVTLKIPRPLYERLQQVIEGTGFHSVTEFCVYVLRDLASSHAPSVDELIMKRSVFDRHWERFVRIRMSAHNCLSDLRITRSHDALTAASAESLHVQLRALMLRAA